MTREHDVTAGTPGSGAPESNRGQGKRRWLRRLVLLLVLLVLLVAAAPTLVSMMGRGLLENRLSENLNGKASLGSLSLGWLSGLSASELVVTVKGAKQPSIKVASLEVKPQILPLLTGGGIRAEVRLDGVTVRARRQDGILDLTRLMRTEPARPPAPGAEPAGETTSVKEPAPAAEPIEVPELDLRLSLSNLQLIYEDDALGAPIQVEHIDLIEGALASDRPAEFRVVHRGGLNLEATATVLAGKQLLPLEKMKGSATLTAKASALEAFAAVFRPWLQALSGRLDLEQHITLEGGVFATRGSLALRDLRAQPTDASGGYLLGSFDLRSELTLEEGGWPSGLCRLDARGLQVAAGAALAQDLDVREAGLEATFSPDGLVTWSGFRVSSDAVALSGSGTWNLAAEGEGSQGELGLQGDMGRLMALVGGLPPAEGHLEGTFTYRMEAGRKLGLQGRTRVADLVARDLPGDVPEIREKEVVLQHDLLVGPDLVEVKHAAFSASFLRAQANGTLARPEGDQPASGTLTFTSVADLGQVRALLGDHLPLDFRGHLEAEAVVRGQEGGYGLETRLRGRDLLLEQGPLEGGPLDLGAVSFLASGHVGSDGRSGSFPEVSLESRLATLRAHGEAAMPPEGGAPRVTVEGHLDLDTDAVAAALFPPERRPALGRAGMDFGLAWQDRSLAIERLEALLPALQASASGQLRLPPEGKPEGTVDLRLEGDVTQMAAVLPEPLPAEVSGRTVLKGRLHVGPVMTFDATLEGRDLAAAGGPLGAEGIRTREATLRASGRYEAETSSAVLDRLDLVSEPLTLNLPEPATLSGIGSEVGPALSLVVDGKAILGRFPASLWRMPEGSRLEGEARLHGELGYREAAPSGSLRLETTGLHLARQQQIDVQGELGGTASLGSDGSFTVDLATQDLRMQDLAGGGDPRQVQLGLQASGRQDRQQESWELKSLSLSGDGIPRCQGSGIWSPQAGSRLKLEAELALDDLTRTWLALFAPEVEGSGQGRLAVDLQVPAGAEKPELAAIGRWEARLDRLQTQSGTLENLVVEGGLKDGLASIGKGDARLNGGTVEIRGELDLRGEDPRWQGSVVAREVEIREELRPTVAQVVPLFAGVGVTVTTKVGTDLRFSGTGTDLEAIRPRLRSEGTIEAAAGKLVGGPILDVITKLVDIPPGLDFQPFNATFRIQDGRVFQDGLQIATDILDLRLSGSTGLDGSIDYKVGLKMKGGAGAKWQALAKVLGPDGFLTLPLGGTLEAPALKAPDPKDLLGNTVEGLLKKGLGDIFKRNQD